VSHSWGVLPSIGSSTLARGYEVVSNKSHLLCDFWYLTASNRLLAATRPSVIQTRIISTLPNWLTSARQNACLSCFHVSGSL